LFNFRKKGLGKDCYLQARNTNGVFGVYGFTNRVSDFYKNEGFNLFKLLGKKYIYIVNPKYSTFLKFWKSKHLNELSKNNFLCFNEHDFNIVSSGKDISGKFDLSSLNTSIRDDSFLKWKFNSFKTDNYEMYKINNGKEVSHIIAKRVRLVPTEYYATKIIDIYGATKELKMLFKPFLKKCRDRGDIYIDYCCIGDIYNNFLESFSFYKLSVKENDHFPELVNPLALKENQYRIAFYSNSLSKIVFKMNYENSYFTRIDSDRERISLI